MFPIFPVRLLGMRSMPCAIRSGIMTTVESGVSFIGEAVGGNCAGNRECNR